MIDVAKEADVALKTVSRYVNGATNINPVLAARIEAAIGRLGYRRNLIAASIRPGWTSRTVGLVISDVSNPYYSLLARGIEEVLSGQGYLLTTASSDESRDRYARIVRRLLEQRVDGLIIVPPDGEAVDLSVEGPRVPPLVIVDRDIPSSNVDRVLADDEGGAFAATMRLLAVGHRRIAFLGDSVEIYTMRQRRSGYERALHAAGLPARTELIFHGAHTLQEAERIAEAVVRQRSADAIFAANNRASMGSLLAFRSAGSRVPLIGYDDFEAAAIAEPPVSVVTHDVRLMGSTAAEVLLERMRGDPSPPKKTLLTTAVTLRGSELEATVQSDVDIDRTTLL